MVGGIEMILITIVSILIGIVIGTYYWGYSETKKDFNNGICPKCGQALYSFDTDSTLARGYECRNCNHIVWVAYDRVDRDYRARRRS